MLLLFLQHHFTLYALSLFYHLLWICLTPRFGPSLFGTCFESILAIFPSPCLLSLNWHKLSTYPLIASIPLHVPSDKSCSLGCMVGSDICLGRMYGWLPRMYGWVRYFVFALSGAEGHYTWCSCIETLTFWLVDIWLFDSVMYLAVDVIVHEWLLDCICRWACCLCIKPHACIPLHE